MSTNAATDGDAPNETCCDNPNIGPVPDRRFKLPSNDTRATTDYCTNCGTWQD